MTLETSDTTARKRWRLHAKHVPYVLLAPFVLLFFIFGLFPLLFSLFLAFQSWEPTSGLSSMTYVGLDNFIFTLEDEWFWKSMHNTFWLAIVSGVLARFRARKRGSSILPLERLFFQWLLYKNQPPQRMTSEIDGYFPKRSMVRYHSRRLEQLILEL